MMRDLFGRYIAGNFEKEWKSRQVAHNSNKVVKNTPLKTTELENWSKVYSKKSNFVRLRFRKVPYA